MMFNQRQPSLDDTFPAYKDKLKRKYIQCLTLKGSHGPPQEATVWLCRHLDWEKLDYFSNLCRLKMSPANMLAHATYFTGLGLSFPISF